MGRLQGWTQGFAGIVVALIALLTSYDYISVWCIVASVALVVADAQLATGFRRRAADEAAEERNRAEQREDEVDRERNRAAEAREQAARRAQRQDRCALAQFEFQLDANPATRRRLVDLTALLREYGELA